MGDFIQELGNLSAVFDWLKAIGTAGGPIFAVLWWFERAERKELMEKYHALVPQAVSAIQETRAAVESLTGVVREIHDAFSNLGQTLIASKLLGRLK